MITTGEKEIKAVEDAAWQFSRGGSFQNGESISELAERMAPHILIICAALRLAQIDTARLAYIQNNPGIDILSPGDRLCSKDEWKILVCQEEMGTGKTLGAALDAAIKKGNQ